jgi:hypothetical protein
VNQTAVNCHPWSVALWFPTIYALLVWPNWYVESEAEQTPLRFKFSAEFPLAFISTIPRRHRILSSQASRGQNAFFLLTSFHHQSTNNDLKQGRAIGLTIPATSSSTAIRIPQK